MISADFAPTFEGWRVAARAFLVEGVPPEEIEWDATNTPSLFARLSPTPVKPELLRPTGTPTVPPAFIALAEAVAYARNYERWDLLYRLLYRLNYENHHLLKIAVDPDVLKAYHLEKSVRRDIHKLHAFVRFRQTVVDGLEIFRAWHRTEHLSLRPGAPFFARRFGDRRWSIFTSDQSAHWDLHELTFGPGMEQRDFDTRDDWEQVWKTYYKSIFNPARIKIKAMKAEMPSKYWASMPETALIADLVRQAPQRLQTMAANHNRAAIVDPRWDLAELSEHARTCTACPLYARATQTVFGTGGGGASGVMIVGEQPGDQEDLSGQPFVGPAGEVLDEALRLAGLRREDVYLTNAVKHFKWAPRGKKRLHQKPNGAEMHACKPWLEGEIARVRPRVILALGATAGTAILGRLPKISEERGRIFSDLKIAPAVIVTWHPAAILRASSPAEMATRRSELARDLALAAECISEAAK